MEKFNCIHYSHTHSELMLQFSMSVNLGRKTVPSILKYYEGNSVSDFDLIDKAFYNYLSASVGYGLSWKTMIELETGYFFNKTQFYNLENNYRHSGHGLSNFVLSLKHSLYSNPFKRTQIFMSL